MSEQLLAQLAGFQRFFSFTVIVPGNTAARVQRIPRSMAGVRVKISQRFLPPGGGRHQGGANCLHNIAYEVLVLYLLKPWFSLSSFSLGCCRFMFRHLDGDLTTMLEMKVPPAPLESVTAFAAAVAKFEKQAGDLLLGRVPDDTSNFQVEVTEQREEAEEAWLDIQKVPAYLVCSRFVGPPPSRLHHGFRNSVSDCT